MSSPYDLMSNYLIFLVVSSFLSCAQDRSANQFDPEISRTSPAITQTSLIILGNVQDAGSPQIGCKKECCAALFENPDASRKVVSLGLIDTEDRKTYLFEATPDIGSQMKMLTRFESTNENEVTDGIFLTHAHIGHYTGLMYLGKEAMDADKTPLYVMPRMQEFLSGNGPWDQLVGRENIELWTMEDETPIALSESLRVTPLLVPHRDEYSETVGYRIQGPEKSALFIPDIDKWEKWEKDIVEEVKSVDYAFLDATFYSGEELGNRDMSEIPHPFILESMETFDSFSKEERNKIIFIHFNHTNPVLDPDSEESKAVEAAGYRIGRLGDVFEM